MMVDFFRKDVFVEESKSTQISENQDGELPEEGEIMEEEEEPRQQQQQQTQQQQQSTYRVGKSGSKEKEHSSFSTRSSHKKTSSAKQSGSSSKSSKYRDYDGKAAKASSGASQQETVMLNSWSSGVQHRRGFRGGSTSPIRGDGWDSSTEVVEKDALVKRSKVGSESDSMDKDFRTGGSSNDDISKGQDLTDGGDEAGDNDFRGGGRAPPDTEDFPFERRRRRSLSPQNDNSPHPGNENQFYHGQHHPFKRHRMEGFGDRSGPSPGGLPAEEEAQRDGFDGFAVHQGGFRGGSRGGWSQFSGRFFRGRGGPFRGGGPPFRPVLSTEFTICKFFREGYCRDGDSCSFSHNAADSQRRPELCKYYLHSYCRKGVFCQMLHGEWPCKAFHKGECTKEQCQFSHRPLDDYTRPLFEKMLKEEEKMSQIAVSGMKLGVGVGGPSPGISAVGVGQFRMAGPPLRKVLLPHGPVEQSQQPDQAQQQHQIIDPATGQIPPPQLVVPPMLANRTNEQQQQTTFGFFNPINPVSSQHQQTSHSTPIQQTSTPVAVGHAITNPAHNSTLTTPQLLDSVTPGAVSSAQTSTPLLVGLGLISSSPQQQPIQQLPVSNVQQSPIKTPLDLPPPPAPSAPATFSISQMLEQITQQVTGVPSALSLADSLTSAITVDESPASPPQFQPNENEATGADARVIPVVFPVCPWRLLSVDVPEDNGMNFDLKFIQTIPHSLNADPRLRRMAERQFEQTTTRVLEEQQKKQQASQNQQQYNLSSPTLTNAVASTGGSAGPVRLADPRRNKDPRTRSGSHSSSQQKGDKDHRESANSSAATISANKVTKAKTDNHTQSQTFFTTEASNVAEADGDLNPDGDTDHRTFPLPPLNQPPPGYFSQSLAMPAAFQGVPVAGQYAPNQIVSFPDVKKAHHSARYSQFPSHSGSEHQMIGTVLGSGGGFHEHKFHQKPAQHFDSTGSDISDRRGVHRANTEENRDRRRQFRHGEQHNEWNNRKTRCETGEVGGRFKRRSTNLNDSNQASAQADDSTDVALPALQRKKGTSGGSPASTSTIIEQHCNSTATSNLREKYKNNEYESPLTRLT